MERWLAHYNKLLHKISIKLILCAAPTNKRCFFFRLRSAKCLGDGNSKCQTFFFADCDISQRFRFYSNAGTFSRNQEVSFVSPVFHSRRFWFCASVVFEPAKLMFVAILLHFKSSWPVFLMFNTTRGENSFIKDAEFWRKKVDLTPSAQSTKSLNTTTPVPETPIPIILKKSFKKLPQWDFEDIYNQDAPPRPTVSALGQLSKFINFMGVCSSAWKTFSCMSLVWLHFLFALLSVHFSISCSLSQTHYTV